MTCRAGRVTQVVQHLPGLTWALSPALQKWGVVSCAWSPSPSEVEVEGSEVQGHPWLQGKFETSLDYVRVYLKK